MTDAERNELMRAREGQEKVKVTHAIESLRSASFHLNTAVDDLAQASMAFKDVGKEGAARRMREIVRLISGHDESIDSMVGQAIQDFSGE